MLGRPGRAGPEVQSPDAAGVESPPGLPHLSRGTRRHRPRRADDSLRPELPQTERHKRVTNRWHHSPHYIKMDGTLNKHFVINH